MIPINVMSKGIFIVLFVLFYYFLFIMFSYFEQNCTQEDKIIDFIVYSNAIMQLCLVNGQK